MRKSNTAAGSIAVETEESGAELIQRLLSEVATLQASDPRVERVIAF